MEQVWTKTEVIRRENPSPEVINADICVIGAGMAGLSAAITAARLGKRVVLVDSFHQVGGQSYNAFISCFCGFYSNGLDCFQLTYGLAEELFEELGAQDAIFPNPTTHGYSVYYNETLFLRWAEKKLMQAGVSVLLGANLSSVAYSGRNIHSVQVSTRYGEVCIQASGYIDASGDAALAWMAGFPCRTAQEGAIFGTMMFHLENITLPAPSQKELQDRMAEKAAQYGLQRKKGLVFYFRQRNNIAYCNMTHTLAPLEPLAASQTNLAAKDEVDKVVHFLKTEFPETFGACSVRVYGANGIRQSRWLKGTKQITLEDVRGGTRFEDAVARSAWPVELHSREDSFIWQVFPKEHIHYIPLGSMLSAECDNYIAAGRCIDGDVAALSSVRVMGPCMATGTAAAHALALAGNGSVHRLDITALQNRLRDNLERME